MPQSLLAPADGSRVWFGMDDYEVVSPDRTTTLLLSYITEPPHGDSLHRGSVANWSLNGYAWGSGISWSPCSRYVAFDWTPDLDHLVRKCLVVDLADKRALVIPEYVHFTRLAWPTLSYRRGAGLVLGEQERLLQLGKSSAWSAA